jgi:hypothetical protein
MISNALDNYGNDTEIDLSPCDDMYQIEFKIAETTGL